MNNKKYLKNCRFCLKEIKTIERSNKLTKSLESQFFNLTQLQLNSNIEYSKIICNECKNNLETFSNLRNKLIQKQSELEDFIKNVKCETIEMKIKDEPLNFEDSILPECFYFEDQILFKNEPENSKCTSENEEATEIFNCKWCRKKFDTEKSLKNHSLNKHKNHLTTEEITNIRRRKIADRKLVCSLCGIQTHYIKDHMRKDHLKITRYFCDHCPYKCYRRCEIKYHMSKHKRPQYLCDLCKMKFARKNALSIHMRNAHLTKSPVLCECGKKCKNKTSLWLHKKKDHSDDTGVRAKCHICNKEVLKSYLKFHIRQVHTLSMEICAVCGKMFKNKQALIYHKRNHKERIFICQYPSCDKKFFMESRLEEHKKTHIQQKDFKCPYEGCDKAYYKSRVMNMHVALHHEKYTLNCPVPACTFSVGRKDYMRAHVSKHKDLPSDILNFYIEETKKMKLW